ncbi:hypothetical protein PM082_005634 [Marasmius tenuissimus]|nr:hypothetical protein PM082_005634 [Marasmius tenuissimus]
MGRLLKENTLYGTVSLRAELASKGCGNCACYKEGYFTYSVGPSDEAVDNGGSDGALTTEFDVAASYGFRSLLIGGLPDVKVGCYELRIQLARKAQYLFRKLSIDLIGAPDEVEFPGVVFDAP